MGCLDTDEHCEEFLIWVLNYKEEKSFQFDCSFLSCNETSFY